MDFVSDTFKNPSNFIPEENPETNKGPFFELAKHQFEINQLCLRVFKTKDGKKLLEWMKSQTLEAPTWDTSRSVFEAIPFGMAREGQNGFIRGLLQRIKTAEQCKSPEDLQNYMRGIYDGQS